jgi:hypothetical protein
MIALPIITNLIAICSSYSPKIRYHSVAVHNEADSRTLNTSVREYILEMIEGLSQMADQIDDYRLAESLKLVVYDYRLPGGMGGSQVGID